jgi:two-component system sensor histidine kinase VicK
MLPTSAPPTTPSELHAEKEGLRAQIQQLLADRTAVAQQKQVADNDKQSQVRFRTVFQNSPLGQPRPDHPPS